MTTTSLSPSKIARLQEMFGASLRKTDGLFDEEAQSMIENDWDDLKPELETACVEAINKVRERKRKTIVRKVKNIRRNRTAAQAIDGTGRIKYVDSVIVDTMPVGDGPEEVELTYFRIGRYASDAEVDAEFETRRLVPDPQAQAADNEADPSFADSHPNVTHWKLPKGGYGFVSFDQGDERYVNCLRYGNLWNDDWWFAGRRKS